MADRSPTARQPRPPAGSARRPARRRLLDRPRRPVLHDAPRRSRRGRHQGRAARRRRDPRLGPALGRRREADGTRTAAYYLAVNRNKREPAARPAPTRRAPRSCAACSPTPTSSSRTSGPGGFARLGFDDAALSELNPRARPPRDLRATARPVRRRPARLRLRRSRPTSGLMSITGAADADGGGADQGGRRDQRRRDRDARRGERARRADRPVGGRRERARPARPSGPAHRRLAPRLDARRARQPGPERVRERASRPSVAATRTRTSSRTRRSRPRTARSPWRSGPSGSGRGSATAIGLPDLADRSAVRHERRPRGAPGRAATDPRGPVPRARHGRRGSRRSRPPTSRAARSSTSSRRSRRPRRSRARDDGRAGAPGLGRHPPGRCPVRARARRRPRSGSPPPTLGQDTDAILAELGYSAGRDRCAPSGRGDLTGRYSSCRRNDQADAARRERDEDDRRDDGDDDITRLHRRHRSRARWPARPGRRACRRPTLGIADTIERTSRAMNPIPAAAAVDPVTVLPRKVIAAHAPRPSQARSRHGDPAGDRRRLEQDRRVDPADDDRPGPWPGRGPRAIGHDLRAEERAARGRLRQDERRRAAVLSRSDTAPIARMIAANAPNWARFFQSWSTASAAVGVGTTRSPNWSPPAALRISGRNFASSGELSPTNRNSPPTTGSRYVRHDSSSSLRSEDAEARPSRGPPDEAEEHVLQRRPHALERGQPDAPPRRRAAAVPLDATVRVGHRHDQPTLGLGDAVDPGDGPERRRPGPRPPSACPGSGSSR